MGNCQAAEAAAVLIQHPNSKIERFYWSLSAHEVMNLNPGHYVALVLPAVGRSENGAPVKKLKLLRSEDMLVIGQVYRLISFEDVLKEFAAKKCVKLGKLLKERGVLHREKNVVGLVPSVKPKPAIGKDTSPTVKEEHDVLGAGRSRNSSSRGMRKHHHHHHGGGGIKQWKPALQSIAEVGN